MTRHPAVCAALLALASTSLHAEPYSLLIYETPAELARRDGAEAASYWSAYNQFAGQLAQAGVLRGGSALSEAPSAPVRGTAPLAAARLGGYFVIDVDGPEAARRWASQAPAGASLVEVRPHRDNPLMKAP